MSTAKQLRTRPTGIQLKLSQCYYYQVPNFNRIKDIGIGLTTEVSRKDRDIGEVTRMKLPVAIGK